MGQDVAMRFMDEAKEAYGQGDMPRAMFAVLTVLDEETTWPMRGHALKSMAVLAAKSGNREAARRWSAKFFREADNNEFPALQYAIASYDAAYTDRLLSDIFGAIRKYEQALPVFRSEGKYVVRCLQNFAWAECMSGDPDVQKVAQLLEESHSLATEGEDLYHQLVGEAHLHAVAKRGDDALAIIDSLLGTTADNTVKAQAAFVAGRIAVDANDKALAEAWLSQMQGYAGDNSDLAYDVRWLQNRIATLD